MTLLQIRALLISSVSNRGSAMKAMIKPHNLSTGSVKAVGDVRVLKAA